MLFQGTEAQGAKPHQLGEIVESKLQLRMDPRTDNGRGDSKLQPYTQNHFPGASCGAREGEIETGRRTDSQPPTQRERERYIYIYIVIPTPTKDITEVG